MLILPDLDADNDERRAAVGKDWHFRLMLKLLSFDCTAVELSFTSMDVEGDECT